jgi:hypothetical protein
MPAPIRPAPALALVVPILFFSTAASAVQILYSQDFESPNNPPGFQDTTLKDVSQQTVNSLYGDQPAGFLFQQSFTVETLEINGGTAFGTGYSDPSGIGGNYALGMLSSVQPDRLLLTFDVGSFTFLNLRMDISSIDLDGVGGPFGPLEGSAPEFQLRLLDSPGGVLGTTVLDVDTASGTASPRSIFDWTSVVFALSTLGNTDGFVTVEIDLLSGNYAAFDNIVIAAADTPGVVPVPAALPLLLSALAGAGVLARRRPAG